MDGFNASLDFRGTDEAHLRNHGPHASRILTGGGSRHLASVPSTFPPDPKPKLRAIISDIP